METFYFLLSTLTITLSVLQAAASYSPIDNFLNCLSSQSQSKYPNPVSDFVYTPTNTSFSSILNMHALNKRFKTASTPKPLAIVTAQNEAHVQATVTCAAASGGTQLRIRSGGHDYEGLSYVSDVPFVVLDMFPQNSVDVDIKSATAWVQSGATIGKLYYSIYQKSKVHAFPAGVAISIGVGGHFSGAGYGNLMRKYGLTADNIIDAKIVTVGGKILDRKAMGEDLFWAIRGGGGASFGVILSWKIKLVHVPPRVTVFRIKKTVEQGVIDVLYKFQLVAPKLDEELFIRAQITVVNGTRKGKKTVQVDFIGQFLGSAKKLLHLVRKSFPELGLKKGDCIEMPWVNSTLFWYDFPIGTPLETLVNIKKNPAKFYFKSKSDYVKKPIPKEGLQALWKKLIKGGEKMTIQFNPYGGKMAKIPSSAIPFPHRAGNLYRIQYFLAWNEVGDEAINRYVKYSRSLYELMTPYVSKSPREAYLNHRDLDIGANRPSNYTNKKLARTTYGIKYFKDNFDRLVKAKTSVDPDNFFRFEQSIPTNNY
ncbi:hypothetical protein RIF29_35998 [Crotalaria pallida]|uniref:FAD-binding PCMH-type domain-containing protein n=1 Tax=Crotalaria pallida TaxID=3830 RepID=A0AAN9HYA0_CROPI